MATSQDYVRFVCEQLADDRWTVRWRMMFGGGMVYINDKPIVLICEDTPYVKRLDCVADLLKNAEVGVPYEGTSPHYVLDIDDRELCMRVIAALEPVTPLPKPRKKRSASKPL